MAYSSGSDHTSNTYKATMAEVGQALVGFDSGVSFLTYNEGNDAMQVVFPIGMVSGSITSPSQGTITVNSNNIDLGLQTGDSPTFTNLTTTGNITAANTITAPIISASAALTSSGLLINNNEKIKGSATGGGPRDLIYINNGNTVIVGNGFENLRWKKMLL